MIKPFASAFFAAFLLIPYAAAQTTDVPDGFAPFQFGMSVSEAREVVPDAIWNEGQFAPNGIEMSGPAIAVGDASMFVRLLFLDARLARIELNHVSRVREPTDCVDAFTRTVAGLEQSVGPLGGNHNSARGKLVSSQSTAGGSTIRVFRNRASNAHYATANGPSSDTINIGMLIPPGDGDLPWGCIQYANLRAADAFFASTASVFRSPDGPALDQIGNAEMIENPVWRRRPTADEALRSYPRIALELGVGGYTELSCLVEEEGTLACAVVDEAPTGMGFAQAALVLASLSRLESEIDGAPTAGRRITLRVPFRAPE